MPSALSKQEAGLYTLDDVKAAEERTGEKHQLIDGRMYAMAGASEKHVAITGNPYASDLAVYYKDKNYYYPDVAVKCLNGDITSHGLSQRWRMDPWTYLSGKFSG